MPRIRDVETMIGLLAQPRRRRRVDRARTRCASTRRRSAHEVGRGAREPHPRVVPARRPAARAARARERAAARRRRDRPAPARPAHPRVRASSAPTIEIGERYELRGRLRGAHILLDEASVMATENAVMAASLAPGRDDDLERRVRAARAGPLPLPRRRSARRSRASARTCCTSPASSGSRGGAHAIAPGAHRGRQLHRHGRGHRRRHHDRGHRPRRPLADPPGLRAARHRGRARRRLGPRAAGPGARRSATTSAARSRRSRTGRGRSSRPT